MNNQLFFGDALECYNMWHQPTVIMSDGPYGISGYSGDLKNPHKLAQFYLPHIQKWSAMANAQTTLWFWNTELGWANVHRDLQDNGWIFKGCNTWNKGISHIAGNCNGKTMKKFPVVTEVCVQYVREDMFLKTQSKESIQNWMRKEWDKTGLGLQEANIACGVKNAASRKYLTKDHLWYFPPPEEFKMLSEYANTYGIADNRPYFSIDGINVLSPHQWQRLRAKFNFEYGVTNVWNEPALRSRYKKDNASHPSEKPLKLIKRIIDASSDKGDVIWEPFAGSGVASRYALDSGRIFCCAEIHKEYFEILKSRLYP